MDDSLDLSGTYHVEGFQTSLDRNYVAQAVITRRGELYDVWWRSGPNAWSGVGIFDGNTLAVSFVSNGGHGVIVFDVMPSRGGLTLYGRWAYSADERISRENLYLVRRLAAPAAYDNPWMTGPDRADQCLQ